MTEQTETPTPATQTPAQAPIQAKAPAIAPDHEDGPAWLPDRLAKARESERKKVLQDLGVTDAESLKLKLAKLSELEAASLTEAERTEKQIQELSGKAQKYDSLEKSFSQLVGEQFSSLPDQQREAIDARASGNAQARWEIMQIMKDAGVLGAGQAPVAPRPASTTAPGAAPPPATPLDPKSPRAIYEAKKLIDPMGAAIYRQTHAAAIEASPS